MHLVFSGLCSVERSFLIFNDLDSFGEFSAFSNRLGFREECHNTTHTHRTGPGALGIKHAALSLGVSTWVTRKTWRLPGFSTVHLLFFSSRSLFTRRETRSPAHTQQKGREARFLEGRYLCILFGVSL